MFIRLTSTGSHARDPGTRFYLNTELIVSFEGRGNHTFIALAEHFEKVKETPEEIFSQLALQNAPPKNRLATGCRNERGTTR